MKDGEFTAGKPALNVMGEENVRPRKKVLIMTVNPVKASLVRFQVDLWGMAPMTATTPADALSMLERYEPDAVLFLDDGAKKVIESVIAVIQERFPYTSAVRIGVIDPFSQADHQLPIDAPAMQLRETLRVACCRKRGPHQKTEEVCDVAAD